MGMSNARKKAIRRKFTKAKLTGKNSPNPLVEQHWRKHGHPFGDSTLKKGEGKRYGKDRSIPSDEKLSRVMIYSKDGTPHN